MAHETLTEAQIERLEMLAEEAAEVVQATTKILRHGYQSFHPDDEDETPNVTLLRDEVHDLLAVLWAMSLHGDLPSPNTSGLWLDGVWQQKLRWTHHQQGRTGAIAP